MLKVKEESSFYFTKSVPEETSQYLLLLHKTNYIPKNYGEIMILSYKAEQVQFLTKLQM